MTTNTPIDRDRPRRPRTRTADEVRRQAAGLFEALPPHAIEAEMSLLGAMLIDHRVIGDVVTIIKSASDFYKPSHGAIYEALVELYDTTASVDIVTLNQRLVDRNVIEAVGGVGYLVRLAESVPSAAFAEEYARVVREKAIVRDLIQAAGEILVEAHESSGDARALLQSAEARIFQIAQRADQASSESLKELLLETMRQLERNEGRHITGLPTGFHELDELTSGLQSGELIIVAARPSMGKTALALNLAENVASAGHPVGVFSLEMGKQQLVQRLLCARSGIDSQRLRRNMLRSDDYRALMAACGELSSSPIYIDDTPGLNLLQLRSKARRLCERFGIQFIVIDYLQLMSAGGRVESRQVEVSEISRGVKAMARELNVPVVCLSQLNRAAEQREGHRPRMSDLRESGSIEQDADVIMMLHREEYYHQSDPEWAANNEDKIGVAELIIAKQRNGPTGIVSLQWDGAATRFRNLSRAVPPAGFAEPRPDHMRSAFMQSDKRGPVSNFRDGGGPDRGAAPTDDDIGDLPV